MLAFLSSRRMSGDVRRMLSRENRPLSAARQSQLLGLPRLQTLLADGSLRGRVGEANRARVRQVYRLE